MTGETPNLPALRDTQLNTARMLAREGCREIVIRKALGLGRSEWKALREADDSALAEALDHGRAEGAAEIIGFMRQRMIEDKSQRAAEWLAERIFDVRPPAKDGGDATPRVVINLGTGPAPDIETFKATRVIEHE